MQFVATIAKRFLTGQKRNRFISFVSAVSLFGVALGVAALVVVMGVMEGFETVLHSVITSKHSHITLFSKRAILPNYQETIKRVEQISPTITAITPLVWSEVLVAHDGKVVGTLIEGIDEETARKATEISKHVVRGSMPVSALKFSDGTPMKNPSIVLGSVVAEKLGAAEGDTVAVVAPFFSKESSQPKVKRFEVGGILSTGMYEYDSKSAFVTLQEAQDFFEIPRQAASALRIKTSNASGSAALARKIGVEMGDVYRALDWSERNQNLLYAIRLQKAVIFVVLTSIVIVAAFNIMSTLMMMMNEKKREMSILKAMGMGPRQSSSVFILVGSIVGLSGAAAGVALGLALCLFIARTRFVNIPADIYFISYLPVDVRFSTLIIIGAVAIFVAWLATLYPARRVAAESPVEGLRYE